MIDFDTRTFPNVVRKPFNWSTRKVLVVGDSIAKGFVNGSTVTAYTWAYWLNQKLGFASLTNGAVGGAAFTQHDGNTIIKAQLEAHYTDDVNLIFVGAGVNDWMRGASYSDVYNAVTELIDYVANNYPANTEIIFVTPIEPAGYHLYDKTRRTGTDSLDDIRQAITDAAIANDTDNLISVIDGKTFGFPNIEGKSAFISLAFGDRLHPSELGYRNIYAPALLERIV
jgi:lysophospholipase L1-like esterase